MLRWREKLWGRVYILSVLLLLPLNLIAMLFLWRRYEDRSVIHIGERRHIQARFVNILRDYGTKATYLAVGRDDPSIECDIYLSHISSPLIAACRDSFALWQHVSSHEVIHCHGMMGITHYQWELILLKIMGRKIIAHFRGCEGRERQLNIKVFPDTNICEKCDYAPDHLCNAHENRRRRWFARKYANKILVTTPDLRSLWPKAIHVPFFLPDFQEIEFSKRPHTTYIDRPFHLVHVTNQPGIEGTEEIVAIVEALNMDGYNIVFRHVYGEAHKQIREALIRADCSIGKMKMGYYANAQIESMILGVPAITWVRDEFMTHDLKESGFVFSSLGNLKETLIRVIETPGFLEEKYKISKSSIYNLHQHDLIYQTICDAYSWRS